MATSRTRGRSRGGARRILAGVGLLGFGAVIGVALGAILDGPRMLVRRWTEEVKVLELPRPSVAAPALEEYASLQTPEEPTADPPAVVEPPARREPEPERSAPTRPEPSRAPVREAGPPSPSPEQLIAEIQQKRTAPVPKPRASDPDPDPDPVPTSVGRSGAAVQVGAYRDADAAGTLVRRLRRAGFDAYLSDQRAEGPNKYRVRVQPAGGSSAKALAAALEERGYGVWITRE
jgi:cell division protein FtsN